MGILNYTTSVDVVKTVTLIQQKLAQASAQAIITEFDDDGIMNALSFRIQTQYGLLTFRLPSQIDGVLEAMENDRSVPNRLCHKEQATRVAWRILKDWIEAQLAIVEAGLAELPEVFLPYAQSPTGKTLFHALKDSGFKQLTAGGSNGGSKGH